MLATDKRALEAQSHRHRIGVACGELLLQAIASRRFSRGGFRTGNGVVARCGGSDLPHGAMSGFFQFAVGTKKLGELSLELERKPRYHAQSVAARDDAPYARLQCMVGIGAHDLALVIMHLLELRTLGDTGILPDARESENDGVGAEAALCLLPVSFFNGRIAYEAIGETLPFGCELRPCPCRLRRLLRLGSRCSRFALFRIVLPLRLALGLCVTPVLADLREIVAPYSTSFWSPPFQPAV